MHGKRLFFIPLLISGLALTSCQNVPQNYYSDDEAVRLDLSENKLTILQLTDLHLTFGIDHNDQRTYRLIDALVKETDPDLVVFTGDMSMAPFGPQLFKGLADHMTTLDVYWTFVFGNHDNDHAPYSDYLKMIDNYDKLLFKVGPELTDGGYGNFKIETYYNNTPFYHLYFLDTHTEVGGDSTYGWLSNAQVDWYGNHAQEDALNGLKSSVFMHIPLLEYTDYQAGMEVDGKQGEGIYHQGENTGFFQKMLDYNVSQAVFVGHDHLNTFSFMNSGILLAYGYASGYNGYGNTSKGGRVIEINQASQLVSHLVSDTEVGV